MSEKPLKVIAGAPDRPLVIGDIEIPCYVLENETRVLSQQGFLEAVGRARKAKGGHGATGRVDKLPAFLAPKNLKPFVSNELIESTAPIPFHPTAGQRGYGYRAELLPQVCDVYLAARNSKALLPSQEHIAKRCEILIRGLATVGVIALVDEATGYQRIREERALATILEKFIAKELQAWTRTFDIEFYRQICRLKRWPNLYSIKRPQVVAHYTNDFVYARLAPGVLNQLRQLNPVIPETGRRKAKLFQWFNRDYGHPRLREHLAAVTALMRAAPNWESFKRSLVRAFPKEHENLPLHLDE